MAPLALLAPLVLQGPGAQMGQPFAEIAALAVLILHLLRAFAVCARTIPLVHQVDQRLAVAVGLLLSAPLDLACAVLLAAGAPLDPPTAHSAQQERLTQLLAALRRPLAASVILAATRLLLALPPAHSALWVPPLLQLGPCATLAVYLVRRASTRTRWVCLA